MNSTNESSNNTEEVTESDRRVVAAMFRPIGSIRQALPGMAEATRLALFDEAYETAEKIAHLPGGLTEMRKVEREYIYSFAWWLNDVVVDLHARLLRRAAKRVPYGGYDLFKARARHRVPVAINGVHVSIALKRAYMPAAPGACLVIEPGPDYESFDLRFLAGLNVEILATGCDLWFSDLLVRCLAADGVRQITARRLDVKPNVSETLFNGERPWVM